ncbi:MAG: hypothetical protein JXR49_13510 [Acidobacteria bacterium]|nr:hypothetical protein [Acidobacteriota bacterium]
MKKLGTILFLLALASLLHFTTHSSALAGGSDPVPCCMNGAPFPESFTHERISDPGATNGGAVRIFVDSLSHGNQLMFPFFDAFTDNEGTELSIREEGAAWTSVNPYLPENRAMSPLE